VRLLGWNTPAERYLVTETIAGRGEETNNAKNQSKAKWTVENIENITRRGPSRESRDHDSEKTDGNFRN
jgi:hypothetical protein